MKMAAPNTVLEYRRPLHVAIEDATDVHRTLRHAMMSSSFMRYSNCASLCTLYMQNIASNINDAVNEHYDADE